MAERSDRRPGHAVRRIARRFAADPRGAVAAEFALLVPVMILLYLGSVELFDAVRLSRLVDVAASTVTNIVTQKTTVESSTLADILDASSQVLAPYPASKAIVVVSSVAIDKKGNPTVAWSQALNGTARPTGSAVTVPANLDIPNADLILGEVTYAYTPPFDLLHLGPFTMYSSIFMVPRDSASITLD